MTPLTSSEKQSRRNSELDAIAQAAGWPTWTRYATAVKRGVVSIERNPAASRANGARAAGRERSRGNDDYITRLPGTTHSNEQCANDESHHRS